MKRNPFYPVILTIAALAVGCAREAPEAPPAVAVTPQVPEQRIEVVPEEKSDRVSKLVGEALRPAHALDRLAEQKSERRIGAPSPLERLELPLPPAVSEVPRALHQATAARTPSALIAEELPATGSPGLPRLPPKGVATAGVRWAGPDLQQPAPLPLLASYQTDRASLSDPSGERSRAIALATPPRLRTEPAPFVPANLPDPFANQRAVRLPTPPAEDPMPPAMSVRTPVK